MVLNILTAAIFGISAALVKQAILDNAQFRQPLLHGIQLFGIPEKDLE